VGHREVCDPLTKNDAGGTPGSKITAPAPDPPADSVARCDNRDFAVSGSSSRCAIASIHQCRTPLGERQIGERE
jgi:hypothetical protein